MMLTVLSILLAHTSTVTVNPPAVELVTMGPGDALYALWGHAALRVVDPTLHQDITVNFGSIDLSEGFWVRMLEGEVNAFVSVSPYPRTLDLYRAEDRTIERRTLALSPEAAQRLVGSLKRWIENGRSTYRYHHFDHNCSTQVADALDTAMGGALHQAHAEKVTDTFRKRALALVQRRPFLYLGIDIALTGAADQPLVAWQLGFLPDQLAKLLDTTEIDGHPLVVHRVVDHTRKPLREPSFPIWPWLWAYIVFAAPIALLGLKYRRIALFLFALPAGLIGTFIGLLALGTRYDFLGQNLNLLIFPPTYLAVAAGAFCRRPWAERLVQGHARLTAASLLIAFFLWVTGIAMQDIGPTLLFCLGPVSIFAWPRR